MALKFLAEYVTATPPSGETPIGLGRYEFVLAICVQIIEWAYRKDLLHYKMMNLPISILKSNRIGIKEADLYAWDNIVRVIEKNSLLTIRNPFLPLLRVMIIQKL